MKYLIEKGANVNVTDKTGNSPLVLSSLYGSYLHLMFDSIAKLSIMSFHLDYSKVFRMLLDAGVDIHTQNINNNSAIHFAAYKVLFLK